jgi:DNA-binding XRE family transcriptional regulator
VPYDSIHRSSRGFLSHCAILAHLSPDTGLVQVQEDGENATLKADLSRRLHALGSGQRIRHLRRALRWTQREAAAEVGISRRTLIRHEQGQYSSRCSRLSMLMRLRDLESDHAEQLIAYFARGGCLSASFLRATEMITEIDVPRPA